MDQKTQINILQEEINSLKVKQEEELLELREQFHIVSSNLKPSNLVGNIFQDLTSGSKNSTGIVDTTIGITTGFLTKKFLFGASESPIKRAIGSVVQFGISNFVYKNSFAIKAVGGLILKYFFTKKEKPEIVYVENEKTVIDIT